MPVTCPEVGVGVIVWRGDDVLLGKRLQPGHDDCWQFPGGHLEAGESVIECALREVREETGLEVDSPRLASYTNQQFRIGDRHYLTLYVATRWLAGEAVITEPDKCGGWQWFPCRALPSPLFEPITLYLAQHGDLRSACRYPDTQAGGHR